MDTTTQPAVSHLAGADKSAVDTPALFVDLDILQQNIARMLIEGGAAGITCAKLGEAEVMAAHGFPDILIANQIVGPQKIARLVALRRNCDVMVAVDSKENVA